MNCGKKSRVIIFHSKTVRKRDNEPNLLKTLIPSLSSLLDSSGHNAYQKVNKITRYYYCYYRLLTLWSEPRGDPPFLGTWHRNVACCSTHVLKVIAPLIVYINSQDLTEHCLKKNNTRTKTIERLMDYSTVYAVYNKCVSRDSSRENWNTENPFQTISRNWFSPRVPFIRRFET